MGNFNTPKWQVANSQKEAARSQLGGARGATMIAKSAAVRIEARAQVRPSVARARCRRRHN